MNSTTLKLLTESPEETRQAAAALAEVLQPGDVLGLQGTLGAGKTCFVKGIARGLGVPDEAAVTSVSFLLMKRHEGRLPLHHFDAYRLTGAGELEAIGAREALEGDGVSVIEWADHVSDVLPAECFSVDIRVTGAQNREIEISAEGASHEERLESARDALSRWIPAGNSTEN